MYKFSKDSKLNDPKFLFGVATASYQIEGATNVEFSNALFSRELIEKIIVKNIVIPIK